VRPSRGMAASQDPGHIAKRDRSQRPLRSTLRSCTVPGPIFAGVQASNPKAVEERRSAEINQEVADAGAYDGSLGEDQP
jgi:hypothetical protein